jgi:Carbohydrate-binding module 64
VTGACTPVTSTIATIPFIFDGAGTFCWQAASLGSNTNNWNLNSLTINGVNFTSQFVASGSYPAKINGFYYVGYNGSFPWSHFEAK